MVTAAHRTAFDADLAGRGANACAGTLRNKRAASSPFSQHGAHPDGPVAGEENAAAPKEVCQLHTGVQKERAFPHMRDSVRAARHFVLGVVGPRYDQGVADDAAIVVTELAANAVLHAESGFSVAVGCSADAVRISVRDYRPVDDAGQLAVPPGHGLSVVAQIADSWGTEPLPDGKAVWARLPAATEEKAGEMRW